MVKTTSILAVFVSVVLASGAPVAQAQDWGHDFRLSSTTFENGAKQLPLVMIYPLTSCTSNGSVGLDQSPELSWTDAPRHTRSFVVIMYDVTASFTHWGMYNISGMATGLPANAGVAGSTAGTQVSNDFGDLSYDGPCPPTNFSPLAHDYVVTVYALDIELPTLPTFGDFPPGPQALYHALIAAGRDGQILDSASIFGFYSAAVPPGP